MASDEQESGQLVTRHLSLFAAFMYLLYSVLLTVGFIALLPRFLFDAARHGKYAAGFRERTGRLPHTETLRGRNILWLHCVSVGETQAARPLARELLKRYPSHTLVVSTVTETGQRLAREVFAGEAAAVFYFPFDWAWTVRRALRAIRPSAVLVMETELWPRFLRECRVSGIPVALVNGRISDTSFRRYKLINPFIRRVVNDLSLALVQTEADASRLAALGLAPERIAVSGNVKFDAETDAGEQTLTAELRARFRFAEGDALIVAASTHAPEERVLLEAFQHLRAAAPDKNARLLIAPRHPERFDEVAELLAASGLRWSRRSATPDMAHDAQSQLILLDSIGELRAVYPLAAIVFVGGSIARTGGHNVLEPAGFARCIVTGAHTFNFKAIIRDFLEREALVQLPELSDEEASDALARAFQDLLEDDDRRREIGARARAALEQSRGATARTVEMLAALFDSTSPHKPAHLRVNAHPRTNV